ncbi:MAG: GUN4 domain-containing protein [Crocosphaera sp.]|nr:GUN4 domain-containing protein [Crocosphaera sp.]
MEKELKDLERYLKERRWKEADKTTAYILLKIGDRNQKGCLSENEADDLPWKPLMAINDLWQQYSNNKFGYTIQKQILLDCGGSLSETRYKHFEKFAIRVKWLDENGNNFIKDNKYCYDYDKAPEGHLPSWSRYIGIGWIKNFISGWSIMTGIAILRHRAITGTWEDYIKR